MSETLKTAVVAAVAAALVGVAIVGTVVATDQPQFCNGCHEMGPFYSAWQHGPHKGMACVECHVEPGFVSHAVHKIVALKEVYVHFSGGAEFPLAEKRALPDERCARCHDSLPKRTANGFEHSRHTGKMCAECHTNAGHTVTAAALEAAGVYAGAERSRLATRPAIGVIDGGLALPNHPRVSCARCHKMPELQCGVCHSLPAKHFRPTLTDTMPACTLCHRNGGASWKADHPVAASDCTSCHRAPLVAKHPGGSKCAECHPQVGTNFAFVHPTIDAEREHNLSKIGCTQCHPTDYTSFTCAKCHKSGVAGQGVLRAAVKASPNGVPAAGPNNGVHRESGVSDD